MDNVVKKTIYDLRKELLIAEDCFRSLHLYGDHVVMVLPYTITKLDEKLNTLKTYIKETFNDVLTVDLFTEYVVIWHNFVILAPEHISLKKHREL